jgi:hypothetical protein
VLLEHAQTWCRGARVHSPGSRMHQAPLDFSAEDALRDVVLHLAGERGETYRSLVERYGAANERLSGAAEIRGRTADLTVVINVDERRIARAGDALLLANSVALDLRRARVHGTAAGAWAARVFEEIAERTAPAWGAVSASDEYWAKVMEGPPGAVAVGRDFGRYLPGIFTANFFGRPYTDLIGRDRLLNAPAPRVESVDAGVLVVLGDDPREWDSIDRRRLDDEVVEYLGREFFFSKQDMPGTTVAPDWATAGTDRL